MALNPLYETMETLLEQHERMLELSEQKKQAIIRNEVNRLTEITTKESRLLKQVITAEESRVSAAKAFLLEKGIQPSEENLKLSHIIQYVTSFEDKRKLSSLRKKLLELVERLKLVNEQNTILIQQAIKFNDFSLDLLMGDDQEVTYRRPTDTYSNKGVNLRTFDSKA